MSWDAGNRGRGCALRLMEKFRLKETFALRVFKAQLKVILLLYYQYIYIPILPKMFVVCTVYG